MGLLGILLGLGLLVWLAFRGWSVLLLAPAALQALGLPGGGVVKLRDADGPSHSIAVLRRQGDR